MRIRWFALLLLLCLLLTGCAATTSGGRVISEAEHSQAYSAALLPYLPGYEEGQPRDNLYAEVTAGNAIICFDVQAVPAMERGVGKYWYPHVLSTMVIAVDRNRTNAAITGWNSLWESGVSVGIGSDSTIRNMLVLGSMSYGLNNEKPEKEDALMLMRHLYQNGHFSCNNPEAPVVLCLDYEAAEWNRAGGNYEIIVPKEGTLSFTMGLLSDLPLTVEPGFNKALLSAGFPLADGRRPEGYPASYKSARTLDQRDYGWFLNIIESSSRDLRRQVFHTRLYTTADLREHTLFAIAIISMILMWRETVSHRMVRRDVRQVVNLMGWLMVGWLMLRLFKYQLLSDGLLCRMCWYGYYIFQLALPVALLYLSMLLDDPKEKKRPRHFWVLMGCYLISVLLVMTNDLHQLVFRFEPGGNWGKDYHYGPGYWAVEIMAVAFLLLAIGRLFHKGRRSADWGGKVFPLLFGAGLLAYAVAYIYRVPLAWESDLTVNVCILSALFFETALHAGLIPVNLQYQRLFSSAPIGLVLLDQEGHTMLSSGDAPPISRSVWKRLLTDMEHPLLRDNDTEYHAVPIHGGMAVWREDISQLNRLQREIQDVQTRLEAANALLREEGEVKKRLLMAETSRQLFEQLDLDMERRVEALAHLIETLPKSQEHREATAYITLCLCHIKRRCNLFFLVRQGEQLLGDELSIYLDELTELARYAGLQMLIRCGHRGELDVRSAAICYDFAFETISWALKEAASPLMGYLEVEGTNLVFRFLPGGDPMQWHFSQELTTAVSALGGQIFCKDLDDAIGVCMTLPMGGEVRG